MLDRSGGRCVRGRHVISTPRLLLRSPTDIDAAAALAAASDADAQRWLGWEPQHLVPEPQRQLLLTIRPRLKPPLLSRTTIYDPLWLVAIHPEHRAYAGFASINMATGHRCEVGGTLGPAYRGMGLGTELFTAIYRLAHHHFGFAEVRAGTEPTNLACRRSLEQAGFVPVTGSSTHLLPDGRTVPAAWFARTEPDATTCPVAGHLRIRP